MLRFEKLLDNIYLLKVPFGKTYTSVFLLTGPEGTVLFDSATTREDAEEIILPAVAETGLTPGYLMISHDHSDHSGGLPWLTSAYPEAEVCMISAVGAKYPKYRQVRDGDVLAGYFAVVSLPGHTKDSAALLDLRSGTMLSGDCLQLKGLWSYGTGVMEPADYRRSIRRVREMGIKNLITSHDYDPLGSIAFGEKAVERYLDECVMNFDELEAFVLRHRGEEPERIARAHDDAHPGEPKTQPCTVEAILRTT